jgi:hypothetical protein
MSGLSSIHLMARLPLVLGIACLVLLPRGRMPRDDLPRHALVVQTRLRVQLETRRQDAHRSSGLLLNREPRANLSSNYSATLPHLVGRLTRRHTLPAVFFENRTVRFLEMLGWIGSHELEEYRALETN